MISLEKAKELKEAGLVWKPYFGDFLYADEESKMVGGLCVGEIEIGEHKNLICQNPLTGITRGIKDSEHIVWFPRLDQILEEIKKRGWDVERLQIKGGKTFILLHRTRGDHIPADWSPYFSAATPEDAVADALLCLLKQEACKQ